MDYVIYERLFDLNKIQRKAFFHLLCPTLHHTDIKKLDRDTVYKKLTKKYEQEIIRKSKTISFLDAPVSLLVNNMNPSFRNSTTLNNYPLDEVKSGIQKYIRRGIIDASMYFTVEMDLFSELPEGKAIRTNMMNRLLVITCDDICLGNPTLPEYVETLRLEWARLRSLDKNIRRQRMILMQLINIMSKSTKYRFLSYIRGAHFKPVNKNWVKKYFPAISKIKYGQPKYVPQVEAKFNAIMIKFAYCIEKKSNIAFEHSISLTESTEKLEKKIYRRTHPAYLVWKYIFDYSGKILGEKIFKKLEPSIKALFNWYNIAKSENWLFLNQAVAYMVRRDDLKFQKNELLQIDHVPVYARNLQNEVLAIDDYCIDIHTKRGRQMGKTKFDFAVEGSYVYPEATNLLGDEYKIIYFSTYVYYKKVGNKEYIDDKLPLTIEEITEFRKDVCPTQRPVLKIL